MSYVPARQPRKLDFSSAAISSLARLKKPSFKNSAVVPALEPSGDGPAPGFKKERRPTLKLSVLGVIGQSDEDLRPITASSENMEHAYLRSQSSAERPTSQSCDSQSNAGSDPNYSSNDEPEDLDTIPHELPARLASVRVASVKNLHLASNSTAGSTSSSDMDPPSHSYGSSALHSEPSAQTCVSEASAQEILRPAVRRTSLGFHPRPSIVGNAAELRAQLLLQASTSDSEQDMRGVASADTTGSAGSDPSMLDSRLTCVTDPDGRSAGNVLEHSLLGMAPQLSTVKEEAANLDGEDGMRSGDDSDADAHGSRVMPEPATPAATLGDLPADRDEAPEATQAIVELKKDVVAEDAAPPAEDAVAVRHAVEKFKGLLAQRRQRRTSLRRASNSKLPQLAQLRRGGTEDRLLEEAKKLASSMDAGTAAAKEEPLPIMEGRSLGVFSRTNPFRKMCFKLVTHRFFDWIIMGFIIASGVSCLLLLSL